MERALQIKLKDGVNAAIAFCVDKGFDKELVAYALIGVGPAARLGLAPARDWNKT